MSRTTTACEVCGLVDCPTLVGRSRECVMGFNHKCGCEDASDFRARLALAEEVVKAARDEKMQLHSVIPTRAVCGGPDGAHGSIRCRMCRALAAYDAAKEKA